MFFWNYSSKFFGTISFFFDFFSWNYSSKKFGTISFVWNNSSNIFGTFFLNYSSIFLDLFFWGAREL